VSSSVSISHSPGFIDSHEREIRLAAIGPVAIQTPEGGPFYSIAGAWLVPLPDCIRAAQYLHPRCFVTTEYKDYRIYLHYIPVRSFALQMLPGKLTLPPGGLRRFYPASLLPSSTSSSHWPSLAFSSSTASNGVSKLLRMVAFANYSH
jgi:hypothetical protein